MGLEAHAVFALGLTISALALFTRDRIPLEYSCTAVLIVNVLVFELFPIGDVRGVTLLQGFGNEALITICLLLVLAKGVEVSGGLVPVGRLLTRIWLGNRQLAMLATLVIAAFISAFANNTPIVVMLLPILVGVAHRAEVAPSRLLMPVGFATIVGGMSTTIGTSTNLLVVNVSEELGMQRLEMFDFTLPAVIAAAFGILYLWIFAPRILPVRPSLLAGSAPRIFNAVIEVAEDSKYVGQTLGSVTRELGEKVRIETIERGNALQLVRLPTLVLNAGDRLHVRGAPEVIHELQDAFSGGAGPEVVTRVPDDRLVEVVVTRESPLHGKTLEQAQRETLRGLYPIGWYRPGQRRFAPVARTSDMILRNGDVLLMQGPRQQINELMDTPQLMILARSIHVPRTRRAPLATGTMIGVVLVAAFGPVSIAAAALVGVGIMLVGRCLTWSEAWGSIDTKMALVIVTSLALGTTLTSTGAAGFLATSLVDAIEGLPAPVILSGLLLLTALLTEIVTNNAVAVIATPIAIAVADQLGQPALPFVLAVLFGANMSYLTPIGYQTNLLVMSAGEYRFSDFFRAGLPLQVLLWIVLSVTLPALYF